MAHVIESFTCSKTGIESQNEDGIFVSDHYIAVIDGTTSKTDSIVNGKTAGQFVRDSIFDTLRHLTGDEPYRVVVDMIQNRLFKEAAHVQLEAASASAIIFSKYNKQIWSIGDCQAYINHMLIRETKIIDKVLSEARAIALNALVAKGLCYEDFLVEDKGRELILPFLKLQHEFENKNVKYGYSVFNISGHPERIIPKVYQVQCGDMVVLASDGYPSLADTLAESERELFELLSRDPLLYTEYVSTKGLKKGNVSFDDRTYIRFIVM